MPNGNVSVLNAGNPVNDQHVNTPNRRSVFPQSYVLANTLRFGELSPHFVAECVKGDKLPFRSSHKLHSFTLKAPLMSDISMKKDYFSVPDLAILPYQFERIFTNPNIGDDVPADSYTSVSEFEKKVSNICSRFLLLMEANIESVKDHISEAEEAETEYDPTLDSDFILLLSRFIQFLITSEYFYSTGSLLSVLGKSMASRFNLTSLESGSPFENVHDFDSFFDYATSFICGGGGSSIDSITCSVGSDSQVYDVDFEGKLLTDNVSISQRFFLDLLRDNGGFIFITSFTLGDEGYEPLFSLMDFVVNNAVLYYQASNPTDLKRLFAYQLVCSHFYSNDRVDSIYSAELYRQNLFDSIRTYESNMDDDISSNFSWNGINLLYDAASSHYFDAIAVDFHNYGEEERSKCLANYLSLIFPYRHSLRFVDYFTGAKTRPLAVGDTSVAVSQSDTISVIDVTRKIQLQRFLNAVNRAGRKFSNYLKEIFGAPAPYDYHDPAFLAHVSDNMFTSQVQNTSTYQKDANSITANFGSNSSRYVFTYDADVPSTVIGITYFDIPRSYAHATDRHFFHQDRFDFFNPFMEFIGDQPVYKAELTDDPYLLGDDDVFGYQTRYMEYKQRISHACSAFVHNLPGFIFIADNLAGLPDFDHISSTYIRSYGCELDEFYTSLSGRSLGSYFHFICLFNNEMPDFSRPMSYSPQIL